MHFTSTFGMPKTIENHLAENTFSENMILKIQKKSYEKMVFITQIEHALNYLLTKVGEIWSTDMIRRLPPFCQVVFEFFAKIMPHKNRPELFWQHLAQLILFLQTSQVVGAYWRVNIFCSCLQPWSESYVKVGLKYTKFYFDIHITYFLNYQIPSNFACIISIIRENIWRKNILKDLIFSKCFLSNIYPYNRNNTCKI